MKLLVLTKRKMLTICACLLVCGLAIAFSITGIQAVQTANARKIPIYSVETTEKQVGLTIDCATGNEQTEQIIQILKQYNLKSTFFVVGTWADEFPQSVKKIADAGHEIGNLANTYERVPVLAQAQMMAELERCNNKITKITGVKPILFRPPYGDYNNLLLETVEELGMKTVQWDVDSLDQHNISVENMVSNVLGDIRNGSIIIVHNGGNLTVEALPKLIEALQQEGYSIVPVTQLLTTGNTVT